MDKKKSFQVKVQNQLTFKIVFIGASAVGKTSIIQRYMGNEFAMKPMSTVGVACESKVTTINDKQVKAQLWDTAGQERFRSLTKNYYRGCDAVIIVFDVTSQRSFDQAESWIQDFNENCDKSAIKLLIANKLDLPKRVVTAVQMQRFAIQHACILAEVSAKDNLNIDNAMQSLLEALTQQMPQRKEKKTRRKSLNERDQQQGESFMSTSQTFKSTMSQLNLHRTTFQRLMVESNNSASNNSHKEEGDELKPRIVESLNVSDNEEPPSTNRNEFKIFVTTPDNEIQQFQPNIASKQLLPPRLSDKVKEQYQREHSGCACQC